MGFFDLFRGKPGQEKRAEAPAEPEREICYSGMRVEVTDLSGRLLFEAKLMNHRGDQGELYQYTPAEFLEQIEKPEKAEESEKPEPLRVRIRGYHDRERKAVYMEGAISPLPKHIWRVEELSVVRIGNDRAFFRLDTNLDAVLTVFSGFGAGDKPCRLVNISVGGACVAAGHRFHEGDKFLLKVKLLEDRDLSVMFCQVLRVTEKGEGRYEYGCRFLELNDADQEKITQNIFAAQTRKRNG